MAWLVPVGTMRYLGEPTARGSGERRCSPIRHESPTTPGPGLDRRVHTNRVSQRRVWYSSHGMGKAVQRGIGGRHTQCLSTAHGAPSRVRKSSRARAGSPGVSGSTLLLMEQPIGMEHTVPVRQGGHPEEEPRVTRKSPDGENRRARQSGEGNTRTALGASEAKEREQRQRSFNDLSAREWALHSKNVWNDVSSPRNPLQLAHGAVFPVKLAERLIRIYSGAGDCVLDPFLGIGSTLVAAQNLRRSCIGFELNKEFAKTAIEWGKQNADLLSDADALQHKVYNEDCRELRKFVEKESVQVTVTSPPYANFIDKSLEDRENVHKKSLIRHANNSTIRRYSGSASDFGNLPYGQFLAEIEGVLAANHEITRDGGYSAWVVKDYRDTRNKIPYVAFHSDLAAVAQAAGWKFHDLIVWDQTEQRRLVLLGYPSVFYTNQNCSFIVVLRKS